MTGKVEGMTKEEVKRLIESQGYEFADFSKSTGLLVYAEKAGSSKLSKALEWGIRTISWSEFAASSGIIDLAPQQAKVGSTKGTGRRESQVSSPRPNHASQIHRLDSSQTRTDQYVTLRAEARGRPVVHNVLKSAEFVWMNGKGFSRVDLSGINALPLSRLHLEQNCLTEIDLSPLQNVVSLEWLILSYNELSDIDLLPLSSCVGLSVLELASNHLTNIDLAPLASCGSLDTLVLSNNKLKDIDLKPLQSCKHLKHLYLSGIGLSHVDLSPLAGCSTLATLYLDANALEGIDLTPICSSRLEDLSIARNMFVDIDLSGLDACESLLSLDLSSNQLRVVDIAPLSQLPRLWRVLLRDNGLEHIDLTPVAESWPKSLERHKVHLSRRVPRGFGEIPFYGCENERCDILLEIDDRVTAFIDSVYKGQIESDDKHAFSDFKGRISWLLGPDLAKKAFEEEGWVGLKKRLKMLPRRAAFSTLSMAELTGVHAALDEVLSWISDDAGLDQGLSEVYSKAVLRLLEDLENNRSTQDLDVDAMKHTSAAVLIPRILEIRRAELESTVLRVNRNGQVDLRELRKTYYGGLLADELKLGWQTDESGLKRLHDSLSAIGLDIVIESELDRSQDKV